MCKPKLKLSGLAVVASLVFNPLSAQEITLKSLDGTVSMSGTLLEYDGTTYRIAMLVGDISIEASQVTCEGAGCPNLIADLTEFSLAGSSSLGGELLPTLIEVFALERGGDLEVSVSSGGSSVFTVLEPDGGVYATISIEAGDSADGLAGLLDGSATIGMSTRSPTANELAAFEENIQGRILALDGVVAAVHQDNPVRILSLAQIAAIFEGDITNWRDVGGVDAPIALYRRDDLTGTTITFTDLTLTEGQRALGGVATILASDAAVSDAVAGDAFGIGLTSYAQERGARALAIRSVCGQLFEPSVFAIKTEEYPLTRRMYLYTDSPFIPDVATEFLDFVSSDAAQAVISNAGFIGQEASWVNLDQQGRRMAQAIVSGAGRTELLQLQDLAASVLDADRLSFTLRYDDEGALDSRALMDIERLAGMIRNWEFSNRQLLVLGFSDNTGTTNAALASTQIMAQDVRAAIVVATGRANMGNVRVSPIGYGQLMPLACNDTPFGQASNNRVEIWVK
ncbi:MAG: substrate-binding domain-containing protein [Rhodobacteraceae bacterium]|nr:substrate-binding domain-containing protein [Paracoccaceae bacterium]